MGVDCAREGGGGFGFDISLLKVIQRPIPEDRRQFAVAFLQQSARKRPFQT